MPLSIALSVTRDLKIFTSTLIVIALVLTIYRVVYRYVMRRFGWEDTFAIVALIGGVICVVTSWTHFELAGQPSVISFWIYALTYLSVVWSVRLSVLFSIIRITLRSNLCRAMLLIAGLFVLMWISLTITFVMGCVRGHRLYMCNTGQWDKVLAQPRAIFELIADVLSDCTLIGLAVYLLRSVKLPYSQQRLIIAAFSSDIFITILSFFRTACQVLRISTLISVAIEIEVACSLFVCNSLFVTTLVYRVLHRNDTATDGKKVPSGTHNTLRCTLQLTTIDLDALDAFSSTFSDSISNPRTTTACISSASGMEKPEYIIP